MNDGTGTDVAGGASMGAMAGSVVPGIGTGVGAGVGALAGLLKGILIDGPKQQRQIALAAATQKYSPWTKLQAQPVNYADPFGSAMGGGTSALMLGQNMQSAQDSTDLKKAMIQHLQSGQAPAMNYNLNGSMPGADLNNYLNNPWSGMGQ